MIEDLRMERRIMQQMFGTEARLVERGPTACGVGRVEIHLGTGRLGSGSGFAAAIADAMVCEVPDRDDYVSIDDREPDLPPAAPVLYRDGADMAVVGPQVAAGEHAAAGATSDT